MSNHLAIATVTASLQRLVQSAIQASVEGARATTVRPNQIASGGTPEVGVNIFLYQAISNPSLANLDAAHMRMKATPVHRHTPLDLYYMFSFYGNDVELQPQRMMGSVVSILSDKSILTSGIIQETCSDPTLSFLHGSDLHLQVPEVTIVPINLSFDDLSKTWSVFYQTPYVLSIGYKVMVVVVEGEESFRRGLPIRDRGGVGIAPFPAAPKIERIIAQGNVTGAIFADTVIAIQGRNLQGADTEVRIGDLRLTPTAVTPQEVLVNLAIVPIDSLVAGMQSLQVAHRISNGIGANLEQGVVSNPHPLLLCPKILRTRISESESTDDGIRSCVLVIQLDLLVRPKQRVVAALNEFTDQNPCSYMFEGEAISEEKRSVRIPLTNIHVGEYLVRLLIDGVETKLGIDEDANSPTYQWYNSPKVRIR